MSSQTVSNCRISYFICIAHVIRRVNKVYHACGHIEVLVRHNLCSDINHEPGSCSRMSSYVKASLAGTQLPYIRSDSLLYQNLQAQPKPSRKLSASPVQTDLLAKVRTNIVVILLHTSSDATTIDRRLYPEQYSNDFSSLISDKVS